MAEAEKLSTTTGPGAVALGNSARPDASPEAGASGDRARLAEAVAGIAGLVPLPPEGLLAPRLRVPLFAGFVALAVAAHAAGLFTHRLMNWSEGAGGRYAEATGLTVINTEIIDSQDAAILAGGRTEEASPGDPAPAAPAAPAAPDSMAAQPQSAPAEDLAQTPPPAPIEPPRQVAESGPSREPPQAPIAPEAVITAKSAETQVAILMPQPAFTFDPSTPPVTDNTKAEPVTPAELTPAEQPTLERPPSQDPPPSPAAPAPQQEASQASQPGEDGSTQAVTDSAGHGGTPAATPGEVKTYHSRLGSHIKAKRPVSRGRPGRVVVTFGIELDGALRFVRIAQSSGNAQLEAKSLAAIQQAAPFPKPPAGMKGKQLEFTVPFGFHQ